MSKSIDRAFSATTAGILVSRGLGYVRDVIIASTFGASLLTDAFFVAFLIPNLFRRLMGEGSLSASFIPIFSQKQKQSAEDARRFAGESMTLVIASLSAFCAFGMMTSPWFIRIFALGFNKHPDAFSLASDMLVWLFPYLILMAVCSIQAGILNVMDKFGRTAIAPAVMNVVWISLILILPRWLGQSPEQRIWTLVWGALAGGLAQVVYLWIVLRRAGFRYELRMAWSADLKEMLTLMIPAALSLSFVQLNVMVDRNIASFLPEGSISILYYAYRLIEFPSALFGTSLGIVALPKAAAGGIGRTDPGVRTVLDRATRLSLIFMIPSMMAFLAFGRCVVAFLYEYGKFTPDGAFLCYLALAGYAVGLPMIGLVRIEGAGFYAVKQPNIPVRAATVALIANIPLSLLLVWIIPAPYNIAGLPLGTSLAAAIQLYELRRMDRAAGGVLRGHTLNDAGRAAFKYFFASLSFAIPLGVCSPLILNLPFALQRISIAALIPIAVLLYFIVLHSAGRGDELVRDAIRRRIDPRSPADEDDT